MFSINKDLRQVLKLHTPEGITFSLPLAGIFSRLLAVILDQAIITALIALISIPVTFLGLISPDFAIAFIILMQFLISTCYGIFLEWHWNGQTIGKRVLKIQVIDVTGMHVTFAQVMIRNLIRIIDMMPIFYFVGGIFFIFNSKNKRLGDIAANTVVVAISTPIMPDFDQILPDKYNSLRSSMHMVARLRSKVNNKTAHLALNALMRRNDLEPEARVIVFSELADYFKSLIAFPDSMTQNLSDEQFIRNVVEILFRTDSEEKIKVTSNNSV